MKRSLDTLGESPISRSQSPQVYVALTSSDLEGQRRAVVRQIEAWGYSVLPFHPLPSKSKGFRDAITAAMELCVLSVHLVSGQTGPILPYAEKSIVALQYESAEASQLDRIVWIRPGSQLEPNVLSLFKGGALVVGFELLENRTIEYLKEVIETKLKNLGLEATFGAPTPPIVRVFVSHSSLDRTFVEREIISPLREHGIETWYSEENIETAAEWERCITDGLKKCDWFLVVMTPRSVASKWVRREVFWAMEKREGRIIPIVMETCEPEDLHIGLLPLQYIDFRENIKRSQGKLLAIWRRS